MGSSQPSTFTLTICPRANTHFLPLLWADDRQAECQGHSHTHSLQKKLRDFFLHLLRSTITSLLPMTRRIHKAQPCLIIMILMVSQRRQICLCIICSFLSHCILPTSAAVFKAQQGKHAELSCRTRHAMSDKGKEVP